MKSPIRRHSLELRASNIELRYGGGGGFRFHAGAGKRFQWSRFLFRPFESHPNFVISLAEGVGFDPTDPLRSHRFSRPGP